MQSRRWPLALASLAVMVVFLIPFGSLRLDNSDAGNDPTNTSSYAAFNMLAQGFGPGFNGPSQVVAELNRPGDAAALPSLRARVAARMMSSRSARRRSARRAE